MSESDEFKKFYGMDPDTPLPPRLADAHVVGGRSYCVTIMDGPANGWSYVTFIPPLSEIRVAKLPDVSTVFHWMRLPSGTPHWPDELRYVRDGLPTEPTDENVTLDGDWFVPYRLAK